MLLGPRGARLSATPWRVRLLLVGGSLVLTFVVAELILRQVVPTATHDALTVPSADPELQFELRPGADLEFDGLTIKIPPTHVRISSLGTRGPELTREKPAGTRRLLCIGDSVTFGWGVAENQSSCAVLAASLGPEWQAVNLGVPGYGGAQKRRMLELRGLPLQPDAVVAQFDQNDRDPPDTQPDGVSVWAWLVDHSAVFRFVHLRLQAGGGPGEGPESGGPPWDGEAEVIRAFGELAARCQAARIPLVVVLRATEGDAVFMASVRARGVSVVDVAPAWTARDSAQLEIPGDGHPNAEGHRLIAAAVLPALQAQLKR